MAIAVNVPRATTGLLIGSQFKLGHRREMTPYHAQINNTFLRILKINHIMDLKDIIKWFIPNLVIFLTNSKFKYLLTVICLFLLFNFCHGQASVAVKPSVGELKNSLSYNLRNNAKILSDKQENSVNNTFKRMRQERSLESGRTFGRPFKKMAAAIIPLAFQIGAASTWAVVAAVVGVKTLLVALVILKLLLVAGAAKFGTLLSHKTEHHQGGWTPHQKEIHLHIHNSGGHGSEHSIPDWNRDGATAASESKPVVVDPYSGGPQTINTPFGNYVKVTKR